MPMPFCPSQLIRYLLGVCSGSILLHLWIAKTQNHYHIESFDFAFISLVCVGGIVLALFGDKCFNCLHHDCGVGIDENEDGVWQDTRFISPPRRNPPRNARSY